MAKSWKKGRGKLGIMQPLLGDWQAQADSPMGKLSCARAFTSILNGSYIRLDAVWKFANSAFKPPGKISGPYQEIAIYGVGDEGAVGFWSFTSDGKRSQGTVADVTDLHKLAIGFEAQMPAGLARMAYWPDEEDGFFWVVESKNAKGWRRFTQHHYRPA
jgi:hypothetical protein